MRIKRVEIASADAKSSSIQINFAIQGLEVKLLVQSEFGFGLKVDFDAGPKFSNEMHFIT